jgi:hypothetical protein
MSKIEEISFCITETYKKVPPNARKSTFPGNSGMGFTGLLELIVANLGCTS